MLEDIVARGVNPPGAGLTVDRAAQARQTSRIEVAIAPDSSYSRGGLGPGTPESILSGTLVTVYTEPS